jgi:hypothetical protein
VKVAYRKELGRLASLSDSVPIDKVNFIRAYTKARQVGITSRNILSGWRVTGNWPISRSKALQHPEIQVDRVEVTPDPTPYLGSDDTPKTSRHVRDLGKNKSPSTRRRYTIIAKGFEAQEQALAEYINKIASLEEELSRLKRGRKRKAIPNPNRRFVSLSEALASSKEVVESNLEEEVVESEVEEEVESEIESEAEIEAQVTTTRAGRLVKRPRYLDKF